MNEAVTALPNMPAEDFSKPYRDMLEFQSQSTDDFLYLIDFPHDQAYFFGNIDKDYSLRDDGKDIHSIMDLMKIVHPADHRALGEDFGRIQAGLQAVHNMNYRWITRDGRVVWINCRGNVVLSDEQGLPVLMIGRVSEETLRHLYKPLTGLWNKTKLREDIPDRLARDSGYLMLVDIDSLAAINLRHGRDYGNRLLREVANLLAEAPGVSAVYHTEHNNFATVIDAANTATVEAVFTQLQETLKKKCTLSAGVVPVSHAVFSDVSSLLDAAKLTLNRAKTHTAFRLEFFSMAEINRKFAELTLLDELSRSTQSDFDGFALNYQPQLNAGNYNIYGIEALLRFTSPSRGPVSPDEFIPLLEQSHLIDTVGIWVMREALRQCRDWRRTIPDLHMSVNISIVQFEEPYLAEHIMEILRELELPGDVLTIEITESVMLRESPHIASSMKYLKAAGVSLSIDDFGMGYSNYSYLKMLNVNEIKIDRSFISGIEMDTYNYKLISSILEFARVNAIRVCCEGVESTRELAVLEALHPDIYQGYLFDRPLTARDMEDAYIRGGTAAHAERAAFVQKLYAFKEKMGIIHFNPIDILRRNNIGLWIIRIDPEQRYCEMHVDDTMERLLGVDRKYTPEECYTFWYDRIAKEYIDYMAVKLKLMIETDKIVQLEYTWEHPLYGEITVRCNGRRVENSDGMIVLEGYHRILTNGDRI